MGGDHKCPLCSATFTRPQHVGRHLRAHTGDRPYECKECPLRFARSDLLSRHVNKAHRPPGENDKKDGRKGRRKSMSSQNAGGANGNGNDGNHDASNGGGMKPRAASFSQFGQDLGFPHMDASGNAIDPSALMNPHGAGVGNTAAGLAQPGHIAQTALPAHQLYPNHPLLANSPRTATSNLGMNAWQYGGTQPGVNGFTGTGADYSTFNANLMGGHSYGMPFTATPMRLTGSEQGMTSGMGRVNSGNYLGMSIDYGTKKRACDQCNHSKVRCDFNDPSRCTTRNLGCSYNKPPKSRSIVQPMPWASRITTTGLGGGVGQAGMSLSPTTQYSSPTSASNVSPIAGTAALDGGISSVARSFTGVTGQHGRSQSFGAASQFYAPTRPGMPVEAYSRTFPALQGWQGGMQQEALGGAPTSFDYVPLGYNEQQQQQQAGQGQYSSPSQATTYYPYGTTGPQISVNTTSVSPPSGTMQPPSIIPSTLSRQVPASTNMRSDGSNGSPSNNLVPTPALSNSHTTSPSSSDDSAERRMSSFGSSGSAVRPEPAVQGLDPSPPPVHVPGPNGGDVAKSALALSPSSMQPYASLDASMTGMNTDWVSPPQMAMGASTAQQQQQQNLSSLAFAPRAVNQSSVSLSTAADEDENNGNTLSRSESLLEEGGTQMSANLEAHRRRSSGVWAQAFSGMSLQDSQLGAPAMISDPFSASQLASQAQAQAEAQFRALQQQVNAQAALVAASHGSGGTMPAIAEGAAYGTTTGTAQGEMPMPSMSDVKDLWKMFMNDPMTGFTPAGEKGNAMDQPDASMGMGMGMGMALATPRPNMGERGLSKSNSMPDLTSPFLGQTFFANYFNNAVTPRPGDGPVNGFDMTMLVNNAKDGKRADAEIPAAAKAAVAQAAEGSGKSRVEVLGPDEVIEPDDGVQGGVNGEVQAVDGEPSEDQQKARNKWKTALSSRPSNFAFQLNNPKVGGRNSASNSVSPPADPVPMAGDIGSTSTTALNLHIPESRMNRTKPSASMSVNLYPGMASTAMGGGMRFDLSGRPSASVIQPRHATNSIFKAGFGAMNQTLAPERALSFMTPGIGAGPSGGLGTGMGMGSAAGGVQVTPPKGGRNALQSNAQYDAHAHAQVQGSVSGSGANPNTNAFPPPPMFAFTNPPPPAHKTSTAAGGSMHNHVQTPAPTQIQAQVPMPISAAANALAAAAVQATAADATSATAALGGVDNVRPPQSHKGSSATTRPGNKRLASQILAGEGKKATFGLWDDEETDVEYVQ